MSEKLAFIIFPETYVLAKDNYLDERFDEEQRRRMLEIISTWEAALEEFGDRVDRVELHFDRDLYKDDTDSTGIIFYAFQIDTDVPSEGRHWR